MPTYEYQCTKCETVFELWQNVGDAPPPCPECAATEVKKIFHPPRVHFKGSGFYLTDLRAEKEKASSGSKAAKTETAPDGKAETKAETKSEPASAATPAKTETSAPKSDSASKPAST